MGCTNNKLLILLSKEIREYLFTKGIITTVEKLPGALNKETDFQYWTVKDSSQLNLNSAIIQKTSKVLGTPDRTFCFQSFSSSSKLFFMETRPTYQSQRKILLIKTRIIHLLAWKGSVKIFFGRYLRGISLSYQICQKGRHKFP